jgi:type IV pilus assembly protein PilQ
VQNRADGANGERVVDIDVRDAGGKIDVDLRVAEDGATVQVSKYSGAPRADNVRRNASGRRYTGAPISMNLKDADIKDVLRTFSKMTGLKIEHAPDLAGTVTVNVTDMPWDEAFDLVLRQNGLTYELEGNVATVK